MCGPREPASVSGALAMLDRALEALASADAASLPTGVQAQALRALERAAHADHLRPPPSGCSPSHYFEI